MQTLNAGTVLNKVMTMSKLKDLSLSILSSNWKVLPYQMSVLPPALEPVPWMQ
jgi:hypothetical protein